MKHLILFVPFFLVFVRSAGATDATVKKVKGKLPFKESWYNPLNIINYTQSVISENWSNLNYNVDAFFSNETYQADSNKSFIRVSFLTSKRENMPFVYSFDPKFKVRLPNTQKKFKIVIERQRDGILENLPSRESEISEDASSTSLRDPVYRGSYNAGVSVLLNESKKWKVSSTAGMRLKIPLDPFVKMDIRRTLKFSFMDVSLSQRFELFRQIGAQETTALSFSKRFGDHMSINLYNPVGWSDRDDEFRLAHALGLSHLLSPRRALSYSLATRATFSPTLIYESYEGSVKLRQRIHRDWFFLEGTIGVEFLRELDFDAQYFFSFKQEVLF